MVNGWATRSVAISALVLRTAIDLQAAIGSAIISSLLIESRSGINFHNLATISTIRAGTSNLWTLAQCVLDDFWADRARRRSRYRFCIVAVCLVVTTSVLQFSSTILLSDLKSGPLVGHKYTSQVRPGLSYSVRRKAEKIPRDSAWTANPGSYPIFAEYHEPPESNAADTGLLLRALLPYATTEARQTLSSYSGNAMVLDARVACQAPKLTRINYNETDGQLTGVAAYARNESVYPFQCTLGETTICQLANNNDTFAGLLHSQFEKSTAFGAAFLVTAVKPGLNDTREWRYLHKQEISVSLCSAPWDAAILDVDLFSDTNRTEPTLQYDRIAESFDATTVIDHFLPYGNHSTRQILKMQKPRSFLGDLPPPHRRPVVQSDMGGSSAPTKGTRKPLPGNWTAFITGQPLVSMQRRFQIQPSHVVSVDPALAAIFKDALQQNNTLSWAMSTLITVLSTSSYYGQQPAFDRVDEVKVSFFGDVLYPRDYTGFTLLLWALAAHFAVMAVLIVMFLRNTQSTLLGNAWSALAQIFESHEVKEHVVGASIKNDSEILKELADLKEYTLRARLVRRGDGTQIVVQGSRIPRHEYRSDLDDLHIDASQSARTFPFSVPHPGDYQHREGQRLITGS